MSAAEPTCPRCGLRLVDEWLELSAWFDFETGDVDREISCPECGADVTEVAPF